MGVGAIFISTLAIHRLPLPSNPPQTQQDILALAIHPIVSFVVLSSVIIHGLSIPFVNLGKNVSRTLSFSTTSTSRSRSHPDWILNVNRIAVTPQEAASEVPNDIVHEAASLVTGTKDIPTSIPEQEHVHSGQTIAIQEAASPVISPKGTPTSILQQEHVHTGQNVASHEAASPVTSAKGTPTSILQQEYVHTGQDVELLSDLLAPPQIPGIETSPIDEERIVNVNIDETELKTVGKEVHFS